MLASFVDGARVRAAALVELADAIAGPPLGEEVRGLLAAHPPPLDPAASAATEALRDTYATQEQAVLRLADRPDTPAG